MSLMAGMKLFVFICHKLFVYIILSGFAPIGAVTVSLNYIYVQLE